MTGTDDGALEQLVAAALELRADGQQVNLEELCRDRPDLLPAVAQALAFDGELDGLGRVAMAHEGLVARELAGRYRLKTPLGSGSMGVVYEAFDTALQRRVAIKILRTELLDGREAESRFDREAKVLAAVRHPAVVSVFDRGTTEEGTRFLVMELLEGIPLSDLLAEAAQRAETTGLANADDTAWMSDYFDREARLETSHLRQVVRWAAELAEGLQAVHDADVLHRDIKPSNVFLRRDGAAMLLDFGIAARHAEATVAEHATPIGTPAYLDPCLLERGGRATRSVDVYGLTSTLYHMVTLRSPYQGTPHEVLAALPRVNPPLASALRPGLPRDLQAVLDCGMDRNPARRYPTARALARDLRSFLGFRPVQARPVSAPVRLARRIGRSREFRAGVVTLVVLLGLLGAVASYLAAVRADEAEWFDVWRRLPPELLDAPMRMRPIADESARRVVADRLERLVELGVEPMISHLHRGAHHLDNGRPLAAAADLRIVADAIDTPYAHAVAACYARVPADATDARALELPPEPSTMSDGDRILLAVHLMRAPDPVRALEVLDALAEPSRCSRHLHLRAHLIAVMDRPVRDQSSLYRQLEQEAMRLEAEVGARTTGTATALGYVAVAEGRFDDTVAILRDGVELAPEAHSLRINYANALRKTGSLAAARQQLEAAIRMRPGTFGARRTLMMTLLDMDDFEAAEALVEKTPFAEGNEGKGQRHWMLGEILMARARLANRHDQAEAKLEFARRAIVEHEAGQACGWGDCDDALLTARAFAGVYGDIVLELLGRAMKNPLDWRTLGDLAATMPEAMTPEQTAAVRAYLLRLRETIAPRLR